MNQNHTNYNAPNVQPQSRQTRQTQMRKDADNMLRDIAFVLKMTERVREEMNVEQEKNLVLA